MSLRALSRSLALLPFLAAAARAQCQPDNPLGGQFVNPPECGPDDTSEYGSNARWALGSVQEISWTTTFTSDDYYNLTLWQQAASGGGATVSFTPIYIHNEGESTLDSVKWVVQTYELDLADSEVFYLEMGWSGPRFFSHYFNITEAEEASATESSPAPGSESTAELEPTRTGADEPGGGLPEGVKIGLGVGLGLGIPILLLLGIFVGIKVVQVRKSQAEPKAPLFYGQRSSDKEVVILDGPYEVSAERGPYEVSTTTPGGHPQVGERHEL